MTRKIANGYGIIGVLLDGTYSESDRDSIYSEFNIIIINLRGNEVILIGEYDDIEDFIIIENDIDGDEAASMINAGRRDFASAGYKI